MVNLDSCSVDEDLNRKILAELGPRHQVLIIGENKGIYQVAIPGGDAYETVASKVRETLGPATMVVPAKPIQCSQLAARIFAVQNT